MPRATPLLPLPLRTRPGQYGQGRQVPRRPRPPGHPFLLTVDVGTVVVTDVFLVVPSSSVWFWSTVMVMLLDAMVCCVWVWGRGRAGCSSLPSHSLVRPPLLVHACVSSVLMLQNTMMPTGRKVKAEKMPQKGTSEAHQKTLHQSTHVAHERTGETRSAARCALLWRGV